MTVAKAFSNEAVTGVHNVMALTGMVLALCLLAPTVFAERPVLRESAVQQIQALMAEKATRTPAQRKIDSKLLYALKRQRGDALFRSVPNLRTRVDVKRDGTTLVDIRAKVSDRLLIQIGRLGGRVVNSVRKYDAVRARLPLTALETLAADADVSSIRTAERFITHKINTSEGDVAHATDVARTKFTAADGSGVKIGVLSDGVASLAALQGSGDLPAGVTVLAGQSGDPGTSEGTAVLEVVYDLAPGAELLFATASGGQAAFAQNIADLAAAGARVIVDDTHYVMEGVFQDDIIAQTVNDFTAAGGLYFSSAGNAGNFKSGTSGVWEGNFTVAPAAPAGLSAACGGLPCDTANFGGGASLIDITEDTDTFFTLKWSDPLGASANDYDLFLLNADGTVVLDSSEFLQDGDDEPYEEISSEGFDDTGNTLAIVRYAGDARCLHLNTNGGVLAGGTKGQIYGHAATEFGFGVAAVDVANAGGLPFTGGPSNPVEAFSSDGPRRIILDDTGVPHNAGDFSCGGGYDRPQPFVAAANRVATATPGFAPFEGTSAAAAHAAGIAGLLQSVGDLNPFGAAFLFTGTALDIEALGFDDESGVGILDGLKAVGAVSPTGSCSCGLPSQACPDDLFFFVKPNNPPADSANINQHLRACETLTFGGDDFSGISGTAGMIVFEDGFESGDTSAWGNSVP